MKTLLLTALLLTLLAMLTGCGDSKLSSDGVVLDKFFSAAHHYGKGQYVGDRWIVVVAGRNQDGEFEIFKFYVTNNEFEIIQKGDKFP